jgi:hypothetical protein
VAPFYGVPSIGFYSQESDLMPAHLDVGWRLGRTMNAPLTVLDAKSVDLLRTLFGVLDAAGRRPEGGEGGLGRAGINSLGRSTF